MARAPQHVARYTAVLTAAYAIFFLALSTRTGNYEFIFYSFIILTLLILLTLVYRRIELAVWIIVSLSLLGFVHLLGGNLFVRGIRLYDVPFAGGAVHFDNVVHTIGIFLATLILYNLIAPFIDPRIKDRYLLFYLLLLLMALGVGALNELIELTAVLFFSAAQGVGDYLNNAYDLLFNALGSTGAIVVIHASHARKRRLKLFADL